ncbi:MAG: PqiC family protein [Glaciimonas sp.]|nr:PqiC family protein [Glaciimonas sp.]
MNNTIKFFAVIAVLFLAGCASKIAPPAQYDFGSLPAVATTTKTLPAISLADVNSPAWLDNTMMMYRLTYANDLQPRPYATTRWTMPPAQLFSQRLKSRIGQAGGAVVALSDGALNMPLLRIDLDDFSQNFDSTSHSVAQVALRASLFNGRNLVAQKTFSRQEPSSTPDAEGGARAFAVANDALITDLINWLATTSIPSTSSIKK